MFAKTQLLTALLALPCVLAAGINCNLDPLTVSGWTVSTTTVAGSVPTTTITFDVTSPDVGTSPNTSCRGTIVGRASVASGGTCDDGGSYSLSGPTGTLTVTLPRECPAGVDGTLTASGQVPSSAECTQTATGETCPTFQLDAE